MERAAPEPHAMAGLRQQWRPASMARNGGQVYGVFGEFFPEKDDRHLLRSHYTKADSVDFERFI
jgi:hypothetical protein